MSKYSKYEVSDIAKQDIHVAEKLFLLLAINLSITARNSFILFFSAARKTKFLIMSVKAIRIHGRVSEIRKRKKVFIFGLPGAGKSTLISSFLHYIELNDECILRRDAVKNPEGVRLIREMTSRMEEKKFPNQTTEGVWHEVAIEYNEPRTGLKKSYAFHEGAGETLSMFDPMHENHHFLDPKLKRTLLYSSGLIVVAPACPRTIDEKEKINDFLELVIRNGYEKPILFLVTKFDTVKSEFEPPARVARRVYRGSVDLLRSYENSSLLPFSVTNAGADSNIYDRSESVESSESQLISSTEIEASMPAVLDWLESL